MSTPTTKLSLSQLTLHNPSRMKDAEIIATFAVRQRLLDLILADIAAEKPRSRALHHLIIGRRGMGKSTLLARIAAELRTDAYSSRFIPLVFAEEQYSVDRLSKFWLNCLDSLADAHERNGDKAAADAIDATIRSLPPAPASQEAAAAKASLEAFLKAAEITARRPVLLVDNLQLVFERLPKAQQHVLRELLMRPGCPILIGASPSALPESQDYGAPFYDHFKVRYLERLSEDEMRQLMLHLAEVFDRPDVRDRVLAHPRRITVLRQLTGGNPRTTVTLFFLYAEDFAPGVFGDLQNLLDRVTPLYKALFEELSVQQQVIASAIANRWAPVTARQLSEDTGLPITGISPQLDRLERIGFIEKVSLQGQSATGFLITERFFNVWFLMRNASRRRRQEVEYLTRFLEMYLENPERHRLAIELQKRQRLSDEEHFITSALLPTLDSYTAGDLRRHAELDALRQKAAAARCQLEQFIDFSSISEQTLEFSLLRERLIQLVPDDSIISPEGFADAVLGDRQMFMDGRRSKLAGLQAKLAIEEVQAVLDSVAKTKNLDDAWYGEEASEWLRRRLREGYLHSSVNDDDWLRAIHAATSYNALVLALDTMPLTTRVMRLPDARQKAYTDLAPKDESSASEWFCWGSLLHMFLELPNKAAEAYREAILREPENISFRSALAGLLHHRLERYKEAEKEYREALLRDPNDYDTLNGLGWLLTDFFKKHHEAEELFLRATAVASDTSLSWRSLAELYHHKLARPADAGKAYLKALDLDPLEPVVWLGYGWLLATELKRQTEAEQAFHKAIEINPELASAWFSLGVFHRDFRGELDDAENCFEKALQLAPTDGLIQSARIFLHRDLYGEGTDAKRLLEEASALSPFVATLHQGLFEAYAANWGNASRHVSKTLNAAAESDTGNTVEDLATAVAVLLHLNYGEETLAMLREQNLNIKIKPWYEALHALNAGDRLLLQNIAPEVRETAEKLYDEIDRRLQMLPEKTRRRPLPDAVTKKRKK